jgi:hypothetical protein
MRPLNALRVRAVVLATIAATACNGDRGSPPPVAIRDSLGVELVESRVAGLVEGPVPRLTMNPVLTIGSVDGAAAELLHGVRAAFRLATGEIGVANAGTGEIRIFGADGTHRRSFLRLGSGPGEIQQMGEVLRTAGDTLLVADARTHALSRFLEDGTFLGRETLPTGSYPAFSEGSILLGDGSRIVLGYDPAAVDRQSRHPQRGRSPIIRLSPEGIADLLLVADGIQMVVRAGLWE